MADKQIILRMTGLPSWEPWIPDGTMYSSKEFRDPLILPRIMGKKWDGQTCKFTKRFGFEYATEQLHFIMEMDKGFVCNGGSIPKMQQDWISPWGQGVLAFIPHDHGYATHSLPRWVVDEMMWDILKYYTSLGNFLSYAAYIAVKWGGSEAYKAGAEMLDNDGNFIDRSVYTETGKVVPDRARCHSAMHLIKAEGKYKECITDKIKLEPDYNFENTLAWVNA